MAVGKYIFYAESTKDGASKFWAIRQTDIVGTMLVSWGKIGTTGQSQEFDTDIATKRKNDKLRKGYVENRVQMNLLNDGQKIVDKMQKKKKDEDEFFNKIDFLKELGKV